MVQKSDHSWYFVRNASEIPSPALLVYPDRVRHNIGRMLALVGDDPARLRPHVKTHKMAEVVRLQLEAGITKCKAATIAEAEMTAAAGAPDVLLAYQPVGPNIERLFQLVAKFPETSFAAVVDEIPTATAISERFASASSPLRLLIDIDCGQHRSGMIPDGHALDLAREIDRLPGVAYAGLHVYDGHLHESARQEREDRHFDAMGPVHALVEQLAAAGLAPPAVVGGGSPTFPLHAARHQTWECSPGTTLFWDAGYSHKFPDLDFQVAAALLTRVISKPGPGLICLDLGHKAVASENPLEQRARFPDLPGARPVLQSEEHLVLELPDSANAEDLPVGAELYAIPWHICPTVALHAEARIIDPDGVARPEAWPVLARNRRITI